MADDSDGKVTFPRKLMKNLILLYKDLPCLWDRSNAKSASKKERNAALNKLTELIQKHDPSATRVHVLRKLESMRACVRREYKKVQESRITATSEDEIYTPNLWYYDIFPFVYKNGGDIENKATETIGSPHQTAESEEEIEEEEHSFSTAESFSGDYSAPSNIIDVPICSPVNNKRYSSFDDEQTKKRPLTEVEDEYDAIGINVAAKLRYLPPNMRVLAEKLINDVLFQAQTNGLTQHTTISTPDPFKQE